MPFDSDSILKLWQKPGHEDVELSASFLDKSFQIRFDVPPPLMSGWRDFLMETLRTALPNHSEDEFQTIYRLVAVRSGIPKSAPTPRELKLIVNQIGALHRQRGHVVPLAHMAYYVLLQRQRKAVVEELLAGELPREDELGLVGDGVRDNLAALALGVEPNRARQLLLEAPVLDALAKPNPEYLRSLKGVSEGFAEVLEHAVDRACLDWPKAEGGKILHAVVALTESGLLDAGREYRPDALAQALMRAARHMSSVTPPTEAAERGLLLLSVRSKNGELAKHLFDAYAAAIGLTPADQTVPRLPQRVLALAKQLHEGGLGQACVNGLQIPGGVDKYFAAVRDLLSDGDESTRPYWCVLRPQATPDATASSFKQVVDAGQFRQEHVESTRLLRRRSPAPPWTPVLEAIRSRLQASQNAKSEELLPLLDALIDLGSESDAEKTLKALVTEGHIAHHVATATSEASMPALARCVYAYAQQTPSFAAPGTPIGQSANGHIQLSAAFLKFGDVFPGSRRR